MYTHGKYHHVKIQVSFTKEPYKRDLYSAKETYNFEEPIGRSHLIVDVCVLYFYAGIIMNDMGWLRLVGSFKL